MLKRQERCGVPFSRTGSAGGDARGKNNGPSPGRLCDARAPASDSEAVSPGSKLDTPIYTPRTTFAITATWRAPLKLHHAPYSRLTAKTRDVSAGRGARTSGASRCLQASCSATSLAREPGGAAGQGAADFCGTTPPPARQRVGRESK